MVHEIPDPDGQDRRRLSEPVGTTTIHQVSLSNVLPHEERQMTKVIGHRKRFIERVVARDSYRVQTLQREREPDVLSAPDQCRAAPPPQSWPARNHRRGGRRTSPMTGSQEFTVRCRRRGQTLPRDELDPVRRPDPGPRGVDRRLTEQVIVVDRSDQCRGCTADAGSRIRLPGALRKACHDPRTRPD